MTNRRIEQLIKIFKETGEYPVLNPNRRPKLHKIHADYMELEWGETPNEAFIRKMQPESILGRFFKAFGW